MKRLDWNEAKNTWLKMERGVGFEDIQSAIEEGRLLQDIDHPLKTRYPNQRVFIVELDGYAYVAPYVEDEAKIFLKTIYPSRKLTRKYVRKVDES